jgi:hypothetical protein
VELEPRVEAGTREEAPTLRAQREKGPLTALQPRMVPPLHNLQVRRPVILAVAVTVVHTLARAQRTAKLRLRNQPVHVHLL